MTIDINLLSSATGRNPLHTAIIQLTFPECKELVLRKNASVHTLSATGRTSLHYAAARGNLSICKLLVDASADVNAKTSTVGMTPLHLAAYHQHSEVFFFLASKTTDLFPKDKRGVTPFHFAASKGQYAICKFLLDSLSHSLSDNLVSKICLLDIIEILHFVVSKGNLDIFELIISNLASDKLSTFLNMCCGRRQALLLLTSDSNLLHTAALYNQPAMAVHLIAKGCNPNVKNKQNKTPLQIAIEEEYTTVCKVLLQGGASFEETAKHLSKFKLAKLEHRIISMSIKDLVKYNIT